MLTKVLWVTQVKKKKWKDKLLSRALNLGPVTGSPVHQASLSPHSSLCAASTSVLALILHHPHPL